MTPRLAAIALVLVLASGLARAQETGVAQGGDPVIEAIFDEIEDRLIRDYFDRARAEDDDGQDQTKKKGKGRKKGWVQGIPPGHLPPPGLCRAWLPDTPPGHQPPPGDCGRVRAGLPEGARLVYGGRRGKDDTLPPGLGTLLPDDLIDVLPLPYPDTERVLVDDDVYLVRQGTRIILDVIEGVLKEE